MATTRTTQLIVEWLRQGTTSNAQLTQLLVQVLEKGKTKAQVSELQVQALMKSQTHAQVTQNIVEVLVSVAQATSAPGRARRWVQFF